MDLERYGLEFERTARQSGEYNRKAKLRLVGSPGKCPRPNYTYSCIFNSIFYIVGSMMRMHFDSNSASYEDRPSAVLMHYGKIRQIDKSSRSSKVRLTA